MTITKTMTVITITIAMTTMTIPITTPTIQHHTNHGSKQNMTITMTP